MLISYKKFLYIGNILGWSLSDTSDQHLPLGKLREPKAQRPRFEPGDTIAAIIQNRMMKDTLRESQSSARWFYVYLGSPNGAPWPLIEKGLPFFWFQPPKQRTNRFQIYIYICQSTCTCINMYLCACASGNTRSIWYENIHAIHSWQLTLCIMFICVRFSSNCAMCVMCMMCMMCLTRQLLAATSPSKRDPFFSPAMLDWWSVIFRPESRFVFRGRNKLYTPRQTNMVHLKTDPWKGGDSVWKPVRAPC